MTFYYECHITIEPVFEERLAVLADLCKLYGFKPAKLLMQKRKEETPERSAKDTFVTGHSKSYSTLSTNMVNLIVLLQRQGYKVWRYKIEDVVLDSRVDDRLNLLGETNV